jgi:hypothetical protein
MTAGYTLGFAANFAQLGNVEFLAAPQRHSASSNRTRRGTFADHNVELRNI